MLAAPAAAALVAVFAWWFSTGAILWRVRFADRAGPAAHKTTTLITLPVFALGLWGLWATQDALSTAAVYSAFFSALAVWGWVELSFLSGSITGPNRTPCPPGIPGWERFIRAWGTIAYHEMLLATLLILIVLVGWGAENTFGLWTYVVLYFARISAKLNLFLGVPKINTEFLPSPLTHLASHFRLGPMNWFFPLAISVLSLAAACWLERLYSVPPGPQATGFALLAAITALALLEHWFMVLPLPDEKLWRWMLPAARAQNAQLTTKGRAHEL